MKRGAVHIVDIIQAYPIFEVKKRRDHIFLRGQVQDIKPIIRL